MKPVARDQAFTVEGAAAFKGLPITVIRDGEPMSILLKEIRGGREGALAVKATIEKIDDFLASEFESYHSGPLCELCKQAEYKCMNCAAFNAFAVHAERCPCADYIPPGEIFDFEDVIDLELGKVSKSWFTAARVELQTLLDKWITENGPLKGAE